MSFEVLEWNPWVANLVHRADGVQRPYVTLIVFVALLQNPFTQISANDP